MEMKMDEKLEFLDILREAANIIRRNISFITFTFLSSLPLFCFLIYYELFLQETFVKTSKFLSQNLYRSYYYDYYYEEILSRSFAFVSNLIQLSLLYLFPYHLLDLLNTSMVVGAASTVYTTEREMGVKDFIRDAIKNFAKVKGSLITSLFVLLFSTSALFGFIWVATNYYVLTRISLFENYYTYYSPRSFFLYPLIVILHGTVFVVLTVKYSKWSAGWNMGLVVSVLEDDSIYGSDALDLSAYYSRGNERRGLLLMLSFFVYGLVLRLPCLLFRCCERQHGIFYTCVYTGLICMGNVFKWVVCFVYYHDSRNRVLEKKADEEIGRRATKPVGP